MLHDYGNIECRDALLSWDGIEPETDSATGRLVTHWDGETMKPSPVTGELIPDDTARIPVWKYVNPRKTEWPDAEFVLGNPPFLGTKRMNGALGQGYVSALRATYSEDVEDNADLVMYWWHKAAELVASDSVRRFGLITTNSVTQTFNRRLLERHLADGVRLVFAIPDHPWVDGPGGASVRIAMTVAERVESSAPARLATVEDGSPNSSTEVASTTLRIREGGVIHPSLRMGANPGAARQVLANRGVCGLGVALHGAGFILEPDEAKQLRASDVDATIRPYLGGRDLLQVPRERHLIDFSGLTEEQARQLNPAAFQIVTDKVLPERRQNKRDVIRRHWWRFGWERPELRRALAGLSRFIGTTETAKHRVFQFIDGRVLPDHMIVCVASSDAAIMGVLSSRVHTSWSLAAGGMLEDRPRYNKGVCFEPFPFPPATPALASRIRDLGEALDAHRKRQQALHPGLTITGMYNVLEKLRSGEPLTTKEKVIHEQGLVSVLKQIHDDLDEAVFEAYGWPATLTDEEILERLVALNAERAEEEKRGLVRWLRPEFQNPAGTKAEVQGEIEVEEEEGGLSETPTAAKSLSWPKALPDRIAALRQWTSGQRKPIDAADAAANFKGAKPADVEPILESLAALGLLRALKSADARRWAAASGRPSNGPL